MVITSLSNNYIKEICKLKEKKYRDSTGTFIIEGDHLVNEAIKNNLVKELILIDGTKNNYDNIKVTYVTKEVMKKISSMESYANIIAIAYKKKDSELGSKILILDNIQDPGNLGTIIRSSVAFNIDSIIMSKDSVDLYNSKVIRSTEGMIFDINIITSDLIDIINDLKKEEYMILGTDVNNGIDIRSIKVPSKFALIMGNEGNGISKDIKALCDKNIYIKMNERVESLNVAVATSILLYEINNGINKNR